MERLRNFAEYASQRDSESQDFVFEDFRSKTPLYPMGYGGIGLYPLSWFIPYSADAILYITQDERLYCNGDGPPFDIRHIPGHKQYGDKINNGEGKPFDITELPGKPVKPKATPLPGVIKPYTNFVKLVTNVRSYIDKKKWKLPPA